MPRRKKQDIEQATLEAERHLSDDWRSETSSSADDARKPEEKSLQDVLVRHQRDRVLTLEAEKNLEAHINLTRSRVRDWGDVDRAYLEQNQSLPERLISNIFVTEITIKRLQTNSTYVEKYKILIEQWKDGEKSVICMQEDILRRELAHIYSDMHPWFILISADSDDKLHVTEKIRWYNEYIARKLFEKRDGVWLTIATYNTLLQLINQFYSAQDHEHIDSVAWNSRDNRIFIDIWPKIENGIQGFSNPNLKHLTDQLADELKARSLEPVQTGDAFRPEAVARIDAVRQALTEKLGDDLASEVMALTGFTQTVEQSEKTRLRAEVEAMVRGEAPAPELFVRKNIEHPNAFVERVYGQYLAAGVLYMSDIEKVDKKLYNALRTLKEEDSSVPAILEKTRADATQLVSAIGGDPSDKRAAYEMTSRLASAWGRLSQ